MHLTPAQAALAAYLDANPDLSARELAMLCRHRTLRRLLLACFRTLKAGNAYAQHDWHDTLLATAALNPETRHKPFTLQQRLQLQKFTTANCYYLRPWAEQFNTPVLEAFNRVCDPHASLHVTFSALNVLREQTNGTRELNALGLAVTASHEGAEVHTFEMLALLRQSAHTTCDWPDFSIPELFTTLCTLQP